MSSQESKPAASLTILNERAARGSREKFEAALQEVADVEPLQEDRF